MTSSITSPEGIINLALGRIKVPRRINSIWEGSRESKASLDIFGQTRDDLLRTQDWPFARRDTALVLLKQAPAGGYVPPTQWNPATNPPLPYKFEYQYPSDSLRIRSIRAVGLFLVNYDPRENRFSVTNDDQLTPAAKTILTNVGPTVVATYSGRLTDPTTFDADFVEALAEALARRLAPMLSDMEAAKVAAENEMRATGEADVCQAG
jgi:hypothetical protein